MWQSNAMIVIGAWTLMAIAGFIVLGVLWRRVRRVRHMQHEAEQRLNALEKQFAWACERIGQFEVRNEGRAYDKAITLARRGADPDRLMTNFGLSRGEADLVALMHNRGQA